MIALINPDDCRDLGLPKAAGAIAMSPWLDLTNCVPSRQTNLHNDAVITLESAFELLSDLLLKEGMSPASPSVNALFGEWNDLPPVAFFVGATERVRDDAVLAAEKIRASNGKVLLEEHPYCPHVYPVFCIVVPESREAVSSPRLLLVLDYLVIGRADSTILL